MYPVRLHQSSKPNSIGLQTANKHESRREEGFLHEGGGLIQLKLNYLVQLNSKAKSRLMEALWTDYGKADSKNYGTK